MNFTILFDNGGGALLMADGYCHSYDDAVQLARDVAEILGGADPRGWDGDEPDFRRTAHESDDVVSSDEVRAEMEAGRFPEEDYGTGHTEWVFWGELRNILAAK